MTKQHTRVEIGRLYTGKRELQLDSRTGAYSESLPPIEGMALDIQKTTLRPRRKANLTAWSVDKTRTAARQPTGVTA